MATTKELSQAIRDLQQQNIQLTQKVIELNTFVSKLSVLVLLQNDPTDELIQYARNMFKKDAIVLKMTPNNTTPDTIEKCSNSSIGSNDSKIISLNTHKQCSLLRTRPNRWK